MAMRSRIRGAGRYWLVLVCAWLVPPMALVGVLVVTQQRETQAVANEPGETVVVGERVQDGRQQAELVFELQSPAPATMELAGRVTAVHMTDGAKIRQGSKVARVGAVDVAIMMSETPLYRAIGPGAAGSDVTALSRFLTEVGHPNDAPSGKYSTSLGKAIAGYRLKVGAQRSEEFDPAHVLWVPPGTARAGSVSLTVGQSAEPGTAALTLPATARAAKVRAAAGEALAIAPDSGGYRLDVGDMQFQVASLDIGAVQAQRIYRKAAALAAPVEGEQGTGTSADAVIPAITVSLAKPTTVGTVPVSAVYATTQGALCLFAAEQPPKPIGVAKAQTLTGELALAAVPKELVGRRIFRDPASLDASVRARCGKEDGTQ